MVARRARNITAGSMVAVGMGTGNIHRCSKHAVAGHGHRPDGRKQKHVCFKRVLCSVSYLARDCVVADRGLESQHQVQLIAGYNLLLAHVQERLSL